MQVFLSSAVLEVDSDSLVDSYLQRDTLCLSFVH